MSLILAIKTFFKSLKEPEKAKKFLENESKFETETKREESNKASHLQLLSLLQDSSRLIDFLKEDITQFSDEQIGAAVRKIHADSAKILEEMVTIRPVREENEGSLIHIEKGYDPSLIKVVGKVAGEPPFSGVLVHKGWKAHKKSLPKKLVEQKEIICPAEVEIR
ncbi:MAG TPA: DUF2760 domain-containing protein [Parachlamydiaceae bacterium]|nr:DUF2760 domain-containing protein [Parachlamydiaceae bacterium]